MSKALDKDAGQAVELAPASPKEEMVTFVSDDESLELILQPSAVLTGADGFPERKEAITLSFIERIFRVSPNETIVLPKSQYGSKAVPIVKVLREHPSFGISFREVDKYSDAMISGDSYIDKLRTMGIELLRAEAIHVGYVPKDDDTRETIIIEIMSKKLKGG